MHKTLETCKHAAQSERLLAGFKAVEITKDFYARLFRLINMARCNLSSEREKQMERTWNQFRYSSRSQASSICESFRKESLPSPFAFWDFTSAHFHSFSVSFSFLFFVVVSTFNEYWKQIIQFQNSVFVIFFVSELLCFVSFDIRSSALLRLEEIVDHLSYLFVQHVSVRKRQHLLSAFFPLLFSFYSFLAF